MNEYKVNNLNEYIDKVTEIRNKEASELWFRGHSKEIYQLRPNFFRDRENLEEIKLKELETKLNRAFNEKAISFLKYSGDDNDDSPYASWRKFFLMQHYGAPTRLLDWTENAITAICFALFDHKLNSTPDTDAHVWILNPSRWNNRVNTNLKSPASIDNNASDPYQPLPNKTSHLASERPLAIYGMHNNSRISRQQGTFVVFPAGKTDCMVTHAQNLWNGKDSSPLHKIIIEKTKIISINKIIRSIGFNNSSIYPDLHGLAGDLKAMLEDA